MTAPLSPRDEAIAELLARLLLAALESSRQKAATT